MSAPFKIGDPVSPADAAYASRGNGVVTRLSHMIMVRWEDGSESSAWLNAERFKHRAPPHAPKAEREAVLGGSVSDDLRIGDVFENPSGVQYTATSVVHNGKFNASISKNGRPSGTGNYSVSFVRSCDWCLISRGPEPKRETRVDYTISFGTGLTMKPGASPETPAFVPAPTPEPVHEWKVDDVVRNKQEPSFGEVTVAAYYEYKREDTTPVEWPDGCVDHWLTKNLILVRRGAEPTPATGITAAIQCVDVSKVYAYIGERIAEYNMWAVRSQNPVRWRSAVEALEQAAAHIGNCTLAAQPATAAKGEREVVGYRIRFGNEKGEGGYWADYCRRWTDAKSESTLYQTFKDAAKDCGQIVVLSRVVALTRRRKPAT